MIISDSTEESLILKNTWQPEFPHKLAVLPEGVTWDQSTVIQKHIYERVQIQ